MATELKTANVIAILLTTPPGDWLAFRCPRRSPRMESRLVIGCWRAGFRIVIVQRPPDVIRIMRGRDLEEPPPADGAPGLGAARGDATAARAWRYTQRGHG